MILISDRGGYRICDGGQRQIQSEEEYKQQEKAEWFRQESRKRSAEENDEG